MPVPRLGSTAAAGEAINMLTAAAASMLQQVFRVMRFSLEVFCVEVDGGETVRIDGGSQASRLNERINQFSEFRPTASRATRAGAEVTGWKPDFTTPS